LADSSLPLSTSFCLLRSSLSAMLPFPPLFILPWSLPSLLFSASFRVFPYQPHSPPSSPTFRLHRLNLFFAFSLGSEMALFSLLWRDAFCFISSLTSLFVCALTSVSLPSSPVSGAGSRCAHPLASDPGPVSVAPSASDHPFPPLDFHSPIPDFIPLFFSVISLLARGSGPCSSFPWGGSSGLPWGCRVEHVWVRGGPSSRAFLATLISLRSRK